MRIDFYRTHWGMHLDTLHDNLALTRDAGFQGVEMQSMRSAAERRGLAEELSTLGLSYIMQSGTGGNGGAGVGPAGPKEHFRSVASEFARADGLDPVLVNFHTGRDIFAVEENHAIIDEIRRQSTNHGIPVVHETHRGRAFSRVADVIALLERYDDLALTADLSHLTCAHESLLEDQVEGLARLLSHVQHIHARVGDQYSAQVRDPRLPECQAALEAHLNWWKTIVDRAISESIEVLTVTVEFGPHPYLDHSLDLEDLWSINCWIKDRISELLP